MLSNAFRTTYAKNGTYVGFENSTNLVLDHPSAKEVAARCADKDHCMDLNATLKCVDLYVPERCRSAAEDAIKHNFGVLVATNPDGKLCGDTKGLFGDPRKSSFW